ncbi:MAG: BMP family ABC transporter substrate-binding protein [Desulfurococcales archaeon]|nr:BMP family ABC transporter substrate-binding protein [Desulfurococcales archaeon]MCE4626159.1 BMP family ABC transporter substrate-binding protein [Desulfurococcales archaeon]
MNRRGLSSKLLAIVLIVIIVAGIGVYLMRGGGETTTTGKIKVLVLFDVGGKGDLSFNDMAVLGAEKAKKELGVEVNYQTPASVDAMVSLLKSVSQSKEYDLIIGVGFLWLDPMVQVAPQFPDQKYAIIDAAPENTIPNLAAYIFREQEVASLVGILAADMAKNIGSSCAGAVAGMDIPPLWRFHIGYLYGIQYYNQHTGSNIQLSFVYTGDFQNPSLGKQTAQQMISQGCRVLYGLAGLTHVGMFDAVKEASQQGVLALAIGQDASQEWYDPEHIIISGLKRVDVAVYDAIKAVVDGTFQGGVHSLGLKDGALGISDDEIIKYFAEIAQEQGRLPQGLTPDDVVNIVNQKRKEYISATAWDLVNQLENAIKNGQIQFVNPTSHDDYVSIINQLEQGNLAAATTSG